MAENRASFVVDLVGNVANQSRRFSSALNKFSRDGSRGMKLLGSAMSSANRVLDTFDNRLMGFVTGGGLVMAAKQVGNTQQQLAELGSEFNLTAEQVNQLDRAISQSALTKNIQYGNIRTALKDFLTQTNDFEGAVNNVDNIARAMEGLKLNTEDAGKSIGKLATLKDLRNAEDITQFLDNVAALSQIGTGDIKSQFLSTIDISKNSDWKESSQLLELLAMQRLQNAEFSDEGRSAAVMQEFFNVVSDKEKQKILKQKGGINVYDSAGTFKSPQALMAEIAAAAKYKKKNLSDVFSDDLLNFSTQYSDESFRQKISAASTPLNTSGLMDEKLSQNVETFNGALTSLANTGERFLNMKLGQPISDLAAAINSLSTEELDQYADTLSKVGMAIGGAIAVRYTYRAGKGLFGGLGGNSNQPGQGDALASDVQKVFVTNWQNQTPSGSNNPSAPTTPNLTAPALLQAGQLLSMLPSQEEIEKQIIQAQQQRASDKNVSERLGIPENDVKALREGRYNAGSETSYRFLRDMFSDYDSGLADSLAEKIESLRPDADSLKTSNLSGKDVTWDPFQHIDIDSLLSSLPAKNSHKQDAQSIPYSMYGVKAPSYQGSWNAYGAFEDKPKLSEQAELDLSKVIPPADGKVTIKVVTDAGTQATAQSVQSTHLNLRVDTGSSRGVGL